MTHDCGHVGYVSHTWLIVMSHGFHAYDPVRAQYLFYRFWFVARYSAANSRESANRFHTMTHDDSWVVCPEGMSHTGLGLGEELLYKGTLRAEDLGHEPSPLHTRGLKSQHHENPSSTSNLPLSVRCISTVSVLHPPYFRLTSLIMSWGPGVLFPRSRLALHPPLSAGVLLPRLALARSATPSRPCYRMQGQQFAVGENLSTS